ncbi:MAG: hypothetical protein ACYCS1_08025 [Gammaproteobacteria bacterium]
MKRKVLKNVRGETLGFLDTDDRGCVTAKNRQGRMVGRYDPKRDLTLNERGQTETHGNSLSSFLVED